MSLLDRFFEPKEDKVLRELYALNSQQLTEVILKANLIPNQSQVASWDEATIKNEQEWNNPESVRRAISSISNYYNVIGVWRQNFDKNLNDTLADNAYFSMMEKAYQDYITTLNWEVRDKKTGVVEDAMDFLEYPNPQESFGDTLKPVIRCILRYDAGVTVKSYNRKGYLSELKSYLGTEFYGEIDRIPIPVNLGHEAKGMGYWSHGYVQRWWQRSRPGVYIAFRPDEVCYWKMYNMPDTIYGMDYLQNLKYQIQYLIDSTRAAGRTFQNGVMPSLVWNHPQVHDIKTLQQRISEVRNNNQGSYKVGNIFHTVKDEKVEVLAHTLHDMQWLEGQTMVASMVWAMFGFQPSEFMAGDSSRAAAYVGRNITKSKMLYPFMRFLEIKINKEILPHIEGWKKDWKFSFLKDVDLDDEIKMSQIKATQAQAASIYRQMGLTIESALKVAGAVDDINTVDIDEDMLRLVQEDAQMKNSTGTVKDDHGNPKKFTDDRSQRTEGYKGTDLNKIPFGKQEERDYKKGITLSREGEGEVKIILGGSSVGVTGFSASEELKKDAKLVIKAVQTITKHNREAMNDYDLWMKELENHKGKFEVN